jgi:hypothetical protein
MLAGCSQEMKPSAKKMPAGKEYSGFLKDYTNLKPNPNLDGKALTYVNVDAQKNLHRYIAAIIDPVQVYLATDADDAAIPQKSREAAARYFQAALVHAVAGAFPITDQAGPLVLRFRTALIGVDAGGPVAGGEKPGERAANISKVGIEIELLDSETGEQIAAMVDREPLGAGAEVGSANISKDEKAFAARAAFDEWAYRVKEFLDGAHALTGEDAERADKSYQPYSEPPPAR